MKTLLEPQKWWQWSWWDIECNNLTQDLYRFVCMRFVQDLYFYSSNLIFDFLKWYSKKVIMCTVCDMDYMWGLFGLFFLCFKNIIYLYKEQTTRNSIAQFAWLPFVIYLRELCTSLFVVYDPTLSLQKCTKFY